MKENRDINNIVNQITKTKEKYDTYLEDYKVAEEKYKEAKNRVDNEKEKLKDYIQILEQLALGNAKITYLEGKEYILHI